MTALQLTLVCIAAAVQHATASIKICVQVKYDIRSWREVCSLVLVLTKLSHLKYSSKSGKYWRVQLCVCFYACVNALFYNFEFITKMG